MRSSRVRSSRVRSSRVRSSSSGHMPLVFVVSFFLSSLRTLRSSATVGCPAGSKFSEASGSGLAITAPRRSSQGPRLPTPSFAQAAGRANCVQDQSTLRQSLRIMAASRELLFVSTSCLDSCRSRGRAVQIIASNDARPFSAFLYSRRLTTCRRARRELWIRKGSPDCTCERISGNSCGQRSG